MRRHLIALLCLTAFAAVPAHAATDYFLELDGIEGESTEAGHKNEIEILSYSWGLSAATAGGAGGGLAGVGKVQFQDFHFVAHTSKASPPIIQNAASGKHIKKAVLHVAKGGDRPQDFLVITLEDCFVTSYQNSGNDGSGAPLDQFSLNYAKISFDYKPQKADGSLDRAVHAGWDLKANKRH